MGVEKQIQEIQGSSPIPKPPRSPLQLVIHVVKKNAVLERMELNKNLTSFKIIISFVCVVSAVHLLLSSMAVLYHVNDWPSY